MSELEIPFALANQWDQMLKTKGHCATYLEIAQWGANQELEMCFKEMNTWGAVNSYGGALADDLCDARRPKL
jgi:hypothetical protein